MKLGIIAGNRLLPLILAQRVKQQNKNLKVIAFCFRGETSPAISRYVDKCFWFKVGELSRIRKSIQQQGVNKLVMAGQINPLNIFKRKHWDEELKSLIGDIKDFRPHTIFGKMINYFEQIGTECIDSTLYIQQDLASSGVMNDLELTPSLAKDIDFGLKMASKFCELDVGQTIGVKSQSIVGLESLEGTDRTIKRIYQLAGAGTTILKFCKANQDLRFDVPVVGVSTLKLLKRIKAASLVLEQAKVIILEKEKFLSLAKKWGIPVVGRRRIILS